MPIMPAQHGDSAAQQRLVLETAASDGIRFVKLQFTDIIGLVMTGSIPVHKLEPLPHDQAGYCDVTTDLAADVRKEMVNALEDQGIIVEASHHEVSVGQHEIDFKYGPALETADNAVTFRVTLKAIAQRHGLYATFMPKPFFGINGSGMHCHQSLADAKTGENLFYDSDDEYGLSDLARHFI